MANRPKSPPRSTERASERALRMEPLLLKRGALLLAAVCLAAVGVHYAGDVFGATPAPLARQALPATATPHEPPPQNAAFEPATGHEGHHESHEAFDNPELLDDSDHTAPRSVFPTADSLPDITHPGGQHSPAIPELGTGFNSMMPRGHDAVRLPGLPVPPDPTADLAGLQPRRRP